MKKSSVGYPVLNVRHYFTPSNESLQSDQGLRLIIKPSTVNETTREKKYTSGGVPKTRAHTSICRAKRQPWITRSSESTARKQYRYKLCENQDPQARSLYPSPTTLCFPLWPFLSLLSSLQFCKFPSGREERDQEEGDDAVIERWRYEPRPSTVDAAAAAAAAAMDGYAVPCGGYGDAAPDDVPAALHALPSPSTSTAVPESATSAPDARINRRD